MDSSSPSNQDLNLNNYKEDRELLLRFILSQLSVEKISFPEGKTLDSLDYEQIRVVDVLKCIKEGLIVDLSYSITSGQPISSPQRKEKPPLPPKKKDANPRDSLERNEPFSSIHSQFAASLSDKAPSVEVPQVPPSEWELNDQQIHYGAYEMLLCCTHLTKGLNEKELKILINIIRPQMQITLRKHNSFLNILKMTDTGMSRDFLSTLDYRMLLLQLLKISHFDNVDEFREFQDRQVGLFFNGILNMLMYNHDGKSPDTIILGDRKLTSVEFLHDLKETLIKAVSPESSEDERKEILASLPHLGALYSTMHIKQVEVPHQLFLPMYRDLLSSIFDFEDGIPLPDPESIIHLLLHFRKRFKISDSTHQFLNVRNWFLKYQKHREEELFQGLQLQLHKTNETYGTNPLEKEIKLAVVNEIEDWLRTSLNDYRRVCPPGSNYLGSLLSLYVQVFPMGTRYRTTTVEADIVEFTRSSANRQYERIATRPFTMETFVFFVEKLSLEVKTEAMHFQRFFAENNWSSYFLQEIVNLYKEDTLYMFTNEIKSFSLEVGQLQSSMNNLHELFIKNGISEDLLPNMVDLFTPLVTNFTEMQEEVLNGFVQRSFEMETWAPLTPKNKHSASVVDLFSMFGQITPFLFSLRLPVIVEFFIGTAGGCINRTLLKYVEMLTDVTYVRKDLLPPSANRSVKGQLHASVVHMVQSRAEGCVPPIPLSAAAKVSTYKTEQLCMRLNDLHYSREHLKVFKQNLQLKAEELQLKIDAPYWDRLFSSSEIAINDGLVEIMQFIASKIVYYDLRGPLIDDLYVPSVYVPEARIRKLFPLLDPVLHIIVKTVTTEMCNEMISWLFRIILEGLEYVLLFGGKERVFEPRDVEVLIDDLVSLQDFFIAKDEKGVPQGLPPTTVGPFSTRVKTIIANLMEWATEFLIEQYESAPSSIYNKFEVLTKQNILAVLIHRTDPAARAFVKNRKATPEYKAIKRGAIVLNREHAQDMN